MQRKGGLPPLFDTVTVSVYDVMDMHNAAFGVGGIDSNHDENILASSNDFFQQGFSPRLVKAAAIRRGIVWAREMRRRKIRIPNRIVSVVNLINLQIMILV